MGEWKKGDVENSRKKKKAYGRSSVKTSIGRGGVPLRKSKKVTRGEETNGNLKDSMTREIEVRGWRRGRKLSYLSLYGKGAPG